jgi:hypothetical protein
MEEKESSRPEFRELDANAPVESLEQKDHTLVYVKTGLGKRYGLTIRPKNSKPILVAVHL